MYVVVIKVTDDVNVVAIKILHKKVDNSGTKKLSNAVMQTKVINCNIANKSCLLQLVHTKAIAASTQSCDFLFISCPIGSTYQWIKSPTLTSRRW